MDSLVEEFIEAGGKIKYRCRMCPELQPENAKYVINRHIKVTHPGHRDAAMSSAVPGTLYKLGPLGPSVAAPVEAGESGRRDVPVRNAVLELHKLRVFGISIGSFIDWLVDRFAGCFEW